MSRRPSVAASIASSSASTSMSRLPSIASPPPLRSSSSSLSWAQRSASTSSAIVKQPSSLDPDELFTKHSVAEVRNVQLRLRADADAKQEELRLMVGERYRDLLQASTSIIALASASERVRSALDEMRAAVPDPKAQLELALPRRAGDSTKNDSHLNALQSLAAHAKLLLDTPEHLWRLLERRRFLPAAWLFLLARVIHRALVRPASDEGNDDEDWKTHGIDVEEQFPLVQRQWETIQPFKSQIAYKASLSLRDAGTTVEDICAVLLTLHLLDSQPLPKTLDTLLAQRTRSLQAAIAHPPTPEDPPTRKAVVRAVRTSLESVLSSIALTLGAARRIFEPPGALMASALSYIQEPDAPAPEGLPVDLQMSTTSLLGSLPSASSQIGLLPESIRGYRPYMGADSSPVAQSHLAERLSQWHTNAAAELAKAAGAWLGALETLADVWAVRRGAEAWAESDSQLSTSESAGLLDALDSAIHTRAGSIWRAQLDATSAAFTSSLSSALQSLHSSEPEAQLDASPASFLFRAPPPVSAHDTLGSGGMAAQFRAYAEGLRAQAAGRAPLLSKVLGALESRGAALAADLKATEGGAAATGSYAADADAFFGRIVLALETQASEAEDARALAFVTRVAHELVRSPFLGDVRAGTSAGAEFEARVDALRQDALERWRALAVSEVLGAYSEAWKRSVGVGAAAGPSSALMQALLSIVSAARTVHASVLLDHDTRAAGETLRAFIGTLLESGPEPTSVQTRAFVWDLRLLRKLALLWGGGWEDVVERLDERITQLESSLDSPSPTNPDTIISDHITRTNVLLAPLLPPGAPISKGGKASSALNGVDSSAPPTMELVKPGPRFGLLLVGAVG